MNKDNARINIETELKKYFDKDLDLNSYSFEVDKQYNEYTDKVEIYINLTLEGPKQEPEESDGREWVTA